MRKFVVLAKPDMDVIGTFTAEDDEEITVDIDTHDMCVKIFEIESDIPADLEQDIVVEKFPGRVNIKCPIKKIKKGFKANKYTHEISKRDFKVKKVK